jgi:HEAT repeat protein
MQATTCDDKEKDRGIVYLAAHAPSGYLPELKATLREHNNQKYVEGKIAAAQAMGGLKCNEAIPAFVDLACSSGEVPKVRLAAVEALRAIGDASVARTLVKRIHPNARGYWDLMTATASALGEFRDPSAILVKTDAIQQASRSALEAIVSSPRSSTFGESARTAAMPMEMPRRRMGTSRKS